MPGERTRKFKEHDPADRWGGSAGGESEYSLQGGRELPPETRPVFIHSQPGKSHTPKRVRPKMNRGSKRKRAA